MDNESKYLKVEEEMDWMDFRADCMEYARKKEEAIQNLKKELEYYFNELHALEKMLYETDVLDNDIIEVDCLGRKIE